MHIRLHLVPRQKLESGEKVFLATAAGLGVLHGLTRIFGLGVVPGCRFRAVTGYPCATCGFTRGLTRLAAFDLSGAFAMNPLVLPFAGFFALGLVHLGWSCLRRQRLVVVLDRAASWSVAYGSLAALVATWLYQIACNRAV